MESQLLPKNFKKFQADFKQLHSAPIGDNNFGHFKISHSPWVQNCRERGRFEAFNYALQIADHAYGAGLSLEDRDWVLNQQRKIVQMARNQVERVETLKRKRSST